MDGGGVLVPFVDDREEAAAAAPGGVPARAAAVVAADVGVAGSVVFFGEPLGSRLRG